MNVSELPQQEAVAAGLDRRFYAFAIDRLIAWGIYAVAGWAAWWLSGDALASALVVVGVVLLVSLVWCMMVGLAGITPGKAALGLRLVNRETGGPIGLGRAIVRQLVLGVAALPVFGLGIGMLAWTAVMDGSGLRRGWHDQVAHSAVVDVRPPAPTSVEEAAPPRRIVNLTAMRLMPVPSTPEPVAVPEPAPVITQPEPLRAYAAPPVPHEPTAYPSDPTPTRMPAAQPQAPQQPTPQPTPQPVVPQPPMPQAPVPPAPQTPQPVAPQPPAAQPAAAPPGSHRAGQPATVLRWRVTFDTGESFVVAGLALVGRKPEPRAGESVAHLVALPSSDMSLSKTHAQFQVAPDGALVVMDRGSTNGSVLIRAGVSRALGPRKPATLRDGDRVRFGDREMTVARA